MNLSFRDAKLMFMNRFTMDHIPPWSSNATHKGVSHASLFYAPQYRTDEEWFANLTVERIGSHLEAYTRNQTWPLGHWLTKPYVMMEPEEINKRQQMVAASVAPVSNIATNPTPPEPAPVVGYSWKWQRVDGPTPPPFDERVWVVGPQGCSMPDVATRDHNGRWLLESSDKHGRHCRIAPTYWMPLPDVPDDVLAPL